MTGTCKEQNGTFEQRLDVSVVVPSLNAAESLSRTLPLLVPAVAEVLVVDGGSADSSVEVAGASGARAIRSARGRGNQLAAGAAAARSEWLLFLHADTALGQGWRQAVQSFIHAPANRERAAYFRFRLDDDTPAARRLERAVAWRCRRFGLPYGDQGLLISRSLYKAAGGFKPIPLMEDVDLVKRLGRSRLTALPADAVTSAVRYRRDGYWRRSARNLLLLSLFLCGVPPHRLVRAYG